MQDAFCRDRPVASRLFKRPSGHRDAHAWCERRGEQYRCESCADARKLLLDARRGDWKAECRLHRRATRAAVRLLAARGQYQAQRRAHRADRPAAAPPPAILQSLGWARWRARRAAWPAPWFIVGRREAEAKLVHAHVRKLRHDTQKRRDHKRDLALSRDRNDVGRKTRRARLHRAAEPEPAAAAAPTPGRTLPHPHATDTGIKIGAGRWCIPFPRRATPAQPAPEIPHPEEREPGDGGPPDQRRPGRTKRRRRSHQADAGPATSPSGRGACPAHEAPPSTEPMRALAVAAVLLVPAVCVQAAERHRTPDPDPAGHRAAQAERDRAANDAASKAAAAKAAAAQEHALAEQRVAAAARLRQAEIATDASAERIAALVRDRAAAEAALAARSAEMAPLLPLIERVSLYPAETMLAVPQPADRALRAVLVLRGLAAGLERDAAALRAEEARIADLTRAEQAEAPRLAQAQSAQARLAADLDRQLAEAASTRTAAENAAAAAARRAADDAAKAGTLQGVLTQVDHPDRHEPDRHDAGRTQEAAARPAAGLFTAPVAGSIVSHWGDATPAGAATGISWRAAPLARVVAPCAGRAVFAAPFRSYGQLVILDCGGGVHVVLAGMQRLDVQPGAALAAGEPVGEMPDWNPRAEPSAGRPTLYFELRRGEQPVDPAPYLRAQG